jgi:hypothetical protein
MVRLVWIVMFLAVAACGSADPVIEGPDSADTDTSTGTRSTTNAGKLVSATAAVSGFMGGAIHGEVRFGHFQDYLTETIDVKGCVDEDEDYEASVHEGTSCASLSTIGEDFGGVYVSAGCYDGGSWNNSLSAAMLTEARIGGDKSLNILGRVAVVTRAGSEKVVACGVIKQD